MDNLTAFIQEFPGYTAVIVAILFSLAISFEASIFPERTMPLFSFILGLLGLLGCFSGALQKGALDIGIVVLSSLAFVWLAYPRKKKSHTESDN